MEQTVYVDLLFLINLSMDFLCLFLVAKLLARPFSFFRGAVAAALGGVYSVVSLFALLPPKITLMADVGVCLLLCLVTYWRRGLRLTELFLVAATFFLASMLLGGIMTAIFNLLNRASPPLDELSDSSGMPLWIFIPVAALSTLLTRIGSRFLRTRAQIDSADVEICLGKRKAVVRAMCDSGNLLRDTVSGKPVIVTDTRTARHLLPPDCPPVTEWQAESVASLPPPIAARIRIIPTGTANAEGLMLALRPDTVTIRTPRGSHPTDALIGFADVKGAHADCTALIPPELLI